MRKILVLVLFLSTILFSPILARAENGVLEQVQLVPGSSVLAQDFPVASKVIFSRLFQALNFKQTENQMRNGSRPAIEKVFTSPRCIGLECAAQGSVSVSDTGMMEMVVKHKDGCRYGDVYNRQTGNFCLPVPTFAPCLSGDIFHSQTGVPCMIKESFLSIIEPDDEAIWEIGSLQDIKWKFGNSFTINSEAVLLFSLEGGPTPGWLNTPGLAINKGEYHLSVPAHITSGDALGPLSPGVYLVRATLYEKQPCLGLCPVGFVQPRILSTAVAPGKVKVASAQ